MEFDTGFGKVKFFTDEEGDKIIGINNVIGSSGDDKLTGDGDKNILEGGFGADTLVGGGGVDTLSYAGDTTGVTVSLNPSAAGGDAEGDTFDAGDFDNLTGGKGNDILTGDEFTNVIMGGGGDDTIFAGVNSVAAQDTLNGGAGSDTVDFHNADSVTVTLGAGGVAADAKDGSDAKLGSVANFENVIGTSGDDKITGNELSNVINGNNGSGDDALDVLDGGGDTSGIGDTLSFFEVSGDTVVDLSAPLVSGFTVLANGIKVKNFENLLGGDGADTLTGNAGNNVIEGGAAPTRSTAGRRQHAELCRFGRRRQRQSGHQRRRRRRRGAERRARRHHRQLPERDRRLRQRFPVRHGELRQHRQHADRRGRRRPTARRRPGQGYAEGRRRRRPAVQPWRRRGRRRRRQ